MAVNENIKKYREEKQFTQQQLADKLYVSRQTICRWENGTRCPDLITAKKLAMELGISMDVLISDEDIKEDQIICGMGKRKKIRGRLQLQEEIEKTQKSIEVVGSIYLGILILGLRPEVKIPIWITFIFACIEIPQLIKWLKVSKKLRESYEI